MGRQRYKGFQSFVQEGCYFLCLCSIAEDVTTKCVDVVEAYNTAIENKWATTDAYIQNPIALLKWLTHKDWTMRIEDKVPQVVADNEWTVLKYYNPKTKYTHFKRRDVDTLASSKTVIEGKIQSCYVFVEM